MKTLIGSWILNTIESITESFNYEDEGGKNYVRWKVAKISCTKQASILSCRQQSLTAGRKVYLWRHILAKFKKLWEELAWSNFKFAIVRKQWRNWQINMKKRNSCNFSLDWILWNNLILNFGEEPLPNIKPSIFKDFSRRRIEKYNQGQCRRSQWRSCFCCLP